MARCDCCGCVFDSDYGTSIVTGSGTTVDPYIFSEVNADWVRPAARVERTTSQSIPNNTITAISFDTENFDTGGFWTVGSPTRLTVSEEGLYMFGGCVLWPANTTGTRELGLRLNGTTILQHNDQPVDPSLSIPYWQQVTYQAILTPTNYLELTARHEAGVSLNLMEEEHESMSFWIVYMGRAVI